MSAQNNTNNKGSDRAIGVNISMPQSLFDKINEKRGTKDRSVFVREAIYKYLETV
jgi:metal-responsive CopG/Arc/MetJ family transcriptional regulator